MVKKKSLTLSEKILRAALELSRGDISKSFTAENLIVQTWESDKNAFGLRGYEERHPDSNKLYTNLDGKDGMVIKGIFKRIGDRRYTLTEAGLVLARSLMPEDEDIQVKASRELHDAIIRIINHPVYIDWQKNHSKPKYFSDAGWFWDISPATPAKVAIARLDRIDTVLQESKKLLKNKKSKDLMEKRGKILFNEKDIENCIEFNNILKKRFENDLEMLKTRRK